jgi:hypothetical protein
MGVVPAVLMHCFFEWFDRELPMGSCVRWTGALQSLSLLGLG